MSKNAELVAVGTEILLGDIVNTHSQFLSQQLAGLGINVFYHTSVGDNPQRLHDVVKQALGRSDVVVFSGGLGPTEDDITKEVVADCLGLPLVEDETAMNSIVRFFERIGGTMTENNKKQAMVPEGSTVFQNKNGTAPGIAIEQDGKIAILLPGPPNELIPMVENDVYDYLASFSEDLLVSRRLRVFGVGESMVETMLGSELLNAANPTTALYAKQGQVEIRVTAKAKTEQKAREMMEPALAQIRSILGTSIYGEDVSSLEEVVVDMLQKQNKTIAVAESCTGGLLASAITAIPGSSKVFEYGTVTYANRIKHSVLRVPNRTLEQYGAVSEETAAAMAKGVIRTSGADIGVAITGIAGPDGGSEEKPVGTVYIAVVSGLGDCEVIRYSLARRRENERDQIRRLSVMHALNMVRRLLLSDSKEEKQWM